jgi:hypothetical protein
MTGKQNIIFFMLVTLMFVGLFISGQAQDLWRAAFKSNASSSGPPAEVKPVKGKCPKGYILLGNKCVNLGQAKGML